MNLDPIKKFLGVVLLACAAAALQGFTLPTAAAAATAMPPTSVPSTAVPPTSDDDNEDFKSDADDADEARANERHNDNYWHHKINRHRHHAWGSHGDNNVVNIGHDSELAAGETADSVVAVFGSATSDGSADEVVSVFGNTRVTGPVSDSAVAVLGNTYIDGKIEGDAVAVLGNVELGPHADVGGDVVAVLGNVHRDPAAVVHGDTNRIFGGRWSAPSGIQAWIDHCLRYGRPLALSAGLGWAWSLAIGLLALYVILALLFRSGIERCVQTVETQPGHTALAAVLAMLLTPVLIMLLFITVIGIAAVPFVIALLGCIALFGKAVMLAWIGHRIIGTRPGPIGHPAVAVLLGGVVVLALYLIPVIGMIVYKLLGIFGWGAVIYTVLLAMRSRQAASAGAPSTSAASTAGPTFAGPAADAADPSAASTNTASPIPPATPPAQHAAPAIANAAMPRAGFWIRMAALFLDVVLIGFVLNWLHPFVHVHLLILAAYGAVMWKLRGSTVGGIIFDLHVVRLDGRPVEWETAIVRALGCFLSLAVAGLGFIWIAFDDANQAWHDKIAGTVVVRVPKGVTAASPQSAA